MPSVNASDETMERIDEIVEASKWNPSKREVVDKAVEQLYEQEVDKDDTL